MICWIKRIWFFKIFFTFQFPQLPALLADERLRWCVAWYLEGPGSESERNCWTVCLKKSLSSDIVDIHKTFHFTYLNKCFYNCKRPKDQSTQSTLKTLLILQVLIKTLIILKLEKYMQNSPFLLIVYSSYCLFYSKLCNCAIVYIRIKNMWTSSICTGHIKLFNL